MGRGAWGVGLGAWGVGRGAWGVGRGAWGVGSGANEKYLSCRSCARRANINYLIANILFF